MIYIIIIMYIYIYIGLSELGNLCDKYVANLLISAPDFLQNTVITLLTTRPDALETLCYSAIDALKPLAFSPLTQDNSSRMGRDNRGASRSPVQMLFYWYLLDLIHTIALHFGQHVVQNYPLAQAIFELARALIARGGDDRVPQTQVITLIITLITTLSFNRGSQTQVITPIFL